MPPSCCPRSGGPCQPCTEPSRATRPQVCCQQRWPSSTARLVWGLLQLCQAALGTGATPGLVTRGDRHGRRSLALMKRVQEWCPPAAPVPTPGRGPASHRGLSPLVLTAERTAILCAERFPKAPGWALGSAPPNPPGFSTGPGCGWKEATRALVAAGATRAHDRDPPGTLLTSARGEHDRPADIILVVHVAFD